MNGIFRLSKLSSPTRARVVGFLSLRGRSIGIVLASRDFALDTLFAFFHCANSSLKLLGVDGVAGVRGLL